MAFGQSQATDLRNWQEQIKIEPLANGFNAARKVRRSLIGGNVVERWGPMALIRAKLQGVTAPIRILRVLVDEVCRLRSTSCVVSELMRDRREIEEEEKFEKSSFGFRWGRHLSVICINTRYICMCTQPCA